eukprot:13226485-Alexandrium_andersonii.AAC.1
MKGAEVSECALRSMPAQRVWAKASSSTWKGPKGNWSGFGGPACAPGALTPIARLGGCLK